MKRRIGFVRILAVLLSFVLSFSACAHNVPGPDDGKETVVDGAGRVLAIPENIESYSISSVYAVSVPFIVALGLTDRVAAINVKSSFWKEANEDLAKAGSIGRGTVDLERLAGLAPTVLIHRSNDPETVNAVTEKLGIEVFCITVENLEDIKKTLTDMGRYFRVKDRAKEICEWIDAKFAWIGSLVSDIPEEERRTALLMGGKLGRVAGSDMLQTWMITQAGGIPVADQGFDHDWVNVGIETVFAWNPDFLFLTASTGLEYNPKKLAEDPVWAGMTAMREKQVFQIPAGKDGWDMPGISCVLGTMYMVHCMYPDRLDDAALQAQIDEYYQMMFGRTFSAAELDYTSGE